MIREATTRDLNAICQMAETFAKGSWKGVLLANTRQQRRFARYLITSPESAILVVDRDGALMGLFALEVHHHPLSGERVATEAMYWVEPQARKARSALALITAAKRWAVAHGATRLFMGAPDEKTGTFYAKLRGTPVETLYQFRLTEA